MIGYPYLRLGIFKFSELIDPDADRIIFWDDSAGVAKFLSVGTSLSLSGTTLNAIQGIRTADSPSFAGLTLTGNLVLDTINISTDTTTGTKIGTGTTQKLGFWNAAPVVQPGHIADPTGGTPIDSEARTAINSILADLAELGLQASS